MNSTNTNKGILIGIGISLLCCLCSCPFAANTLGNNPTPAVVVQDSATQDNLVQTQVAQIIRTQLAMNEVSNQSSAATIAATDLISGVLPVPVDSFATLIPQPVSGSIQITFINVGQGDSILIQSPEMKFGLIDGGESGSGALQYLQSHGVTNLDLMVNSHPHSDHIGGLVEILRSIPVTRIVTNGQMHTTGIYEGFLDAVLASNAEYLEVKRGDKLTLGSLTLDVLHPGIITGDDLNINSIVLRLAYGDISFLFMGDANAVSYQEILASGVNTQSTFLKVGHHGSPDSIDPISLANVHPNFAVYMAGKGNDYGHPATNIIEQIKSTGAQVYGTDVNGTISVTTDGTGVSIQIDNDSSPMATPVPAAPLVPIPAPVESSMQVSSLTSPINAGGIASLTIQTTPSSNCSIVVNYKSGTSQAAGLGPQIADQNGQVTWSWKVGPNTTPGVWSIRVTCSKDGNSSSLTIPFEVYL